VIDGANSSRRDGTWAGWRRPSFSFLTDGSGLELDGRPAEGCVKTHGDTVPFEYDETARTERVGFARSPRVTDVISSAMLCWRCSLVDGQPARAARAAARAPSRSDYEVPAKRIPGSADRRAV